MAKFPMHKKNWKHGVEKCVMVVLLVVMMVSWLVGQLSSYLPNRPSLCIYFLVIIPPHCITKITKNQQKYHLNPVHIKKIVIKFLSGH